ADVVAGDRVRVQAELHPGLGLLLEVLLVFLVAEVLRPGALDRQVHAPAAVADAVDQSHAAAGEYLADLVQVEDDVAGLPDLRDALLGRRPAPLAHGAAGDPRPRRRRDADGPLGARQHEGGAALPAAGPLAEQGVVHLVLRLAARAGHLESGHSRAPLHRDTPGTRA